MIRVGLLGASKISRGAILTPASGMDDVDISRVAASDPRRAAAFADEHGIAGIEADYAALIASEQVDLVYNALPPSGHARWSIAAVEAGKHVLCEKPFAMNANEAHRMVDAAGKHGRLLIEAFHYRFHPLFERVLDLLQRDTIGAIRHIDSRFNVPIACTPGELRYDPKLGGGAMMDLGCYAVHWVRTVMAAEPDVKSSEATWHESGVDIAMRAELGFDGGATAVVSSAMDERLPAGRDAVLDIKGETGRLTVDNPAAPHTGHELRIVSQDESTTETVAGNSTYWHQLRHVIAVLDGREAPLTGGTDAIANMRVLDEIYRQAGAAR